MATKPTLQDSMTAMKMFTGKIEPDLKYDVNGDGVVNLTDQMGLLNSYLGKDPGFAFVSNVFSSPSSKTAEEYAAENKANQERIAADQKETERRQALLADAQKISGLVNTELVANNPNLTPQQLASLATKNYWSNESEAFSRVTDAMQKGTAEIRQIPLGTDEFGNMANQLAIVDPSDPNRGRLDLRETSQPNVYQFATTNDVAGGMIKGVIQADPSKGTYTPIQDYTKQVVYTPGQSGGILGDMAGSFGDIIKELGPISTIIGNAITPGLGTALSVAAAVDEGANIEDIIKNVAVGEIVNKVGVGSELTDSATAADLVDNTLKGLLTGQDLDQALTNSVVSSVAGEVTNQKPEDFQADVETVLDSPASTPVSDYFADINDVLDMPATQEPVSGQDLSADLTGANTLDDITAALAGEGDFISGQDLAADSVPGNTINDIVDVLPPTPPAEPGLTKAQVETLIKTALAATVADQAINQPESKPPGFDIVPVPTDWSSPVYDQSFTPVDLDSIFQNLQGAQTQWKPRPSITGGAYMGSPVNISDIVNNIMSAELTPQAMPTNITNAVGGILGSSTTR